MVTVPDRRRAPYAPNAPYETAAAPEQQDFAPPPPAQGPLERFVDTMKPSSIFARMRELGDRIEAAGNDILPEDRGLIIADSFGAAVLREAAHHPLAGARRKAVTLRFARAAASLLHALADPDGVPDGRL